MNILTEAVIPVTAGAKAPPLVPWRDYQTRLPTAEEQVAWRQQWPACNWALITGRVSNTVVLDIDAHRNGEAAVRDRVLPITRIVATPRQGLHYYFAYPHTAVASAVDILPGCDMRGDGGYILVPPSRVNGHAYELVVDQPVAPMPPWLLELVTAPAHPNGQRLDETEITRLLQGVPEGQRDTTATRLAGHFIGKRLPAGEVFALLRIWNARNHPPLPDDQLRKVVESITAIDARNHPAGGTLDDVHRVVREWLLVPDTYTIDLTLATVLANRLPGDPFWMFLIAPPGGGKTEQLNAISGAPDVYPLSDLTPQTFLSGKQGDTDASLLPKLSGKILVLKDFTTVLTMHREARQQILAQLREIYDGAYRKAFGTGQVLQWSGKVGFLAGVTPILDHYHAVSQVLGERFVQFRLATVDGNAVARSAMRQRGREREMRGALREVTSAFLAARTDPLPVDLPEPVAEAIATLSTLVVRARSGIIRDAFSTRTIELVPEPEAPTRLPKQLATLVVGLAVAADRTVVRDTDLALVTRVALDCIPRPRFLVLRHLASLDRLVNTPTIAEAVGYPTTATRRILEDLTALGLAHVDKGGLGMKDEWALPDAVKTPFRTALARAFGTLPEMSEDPISLSLLPPSDFSGKV